MALGCHSQVEFCNYRVFSKTVWFCEFKGFKTPFWFWRTYFEGGFLVLSLVFYSCLRIRLVDWSLFACVDGRFKGTAFGGFVAWRLCRWTGWLVGAGLPPIMMIPTMSATERRLRDGVKSGWWSLFWVLPIPVAGWFWLIPWLVADSKGSLEETDWLVDYCLLRGYRLSGLYNV